MPECCDAKLLEVFFRQARKNRFVYLILAECSLILLKPQAPQPTSERFHEGALNRLPLMIVQPGRRVQRCSSPKRVNRVISG
jgi:hypothetical protein